MDKRVKYLATSLLLLILVLLTIIYYDRGVAFSAGRETILPGVKIANVDFSGLNRQQGLVRLAEIEQDLLKTTVTLSHQGDSWPLDLSQIGLEIDAEKTLQHALALGQEGPLLKRWQLRHRIKQQGYNLPPVFKIDTKRLAEAVNGLAGQLNVAPVNALLNINEQDQVVITPSKNGQRIDVERLAQVLRQELLVSDNITLALPVTTVPPEYSTEDIEAMGINGLLASYTTKYDAKIVNRAYNIKVAANALDGLIVAPGEEVSFNEVVGPRSSEAGYKSAGVIVNNQLVDDLGGGVCQVSTTLYNAVLLAGLELVERYNHSLPVSYVPVGQDATVVYGALDFKFQNNTNHCLYIKTEVKSNQLTIKIFGDTKSAYQVTVRSWIEKVLEPQVIYQEDENLKKGQQIVKQQGAKGYIARAERVFMRDGKVVKRESLPSSRYNAVNKIIAVGTTEPQPAVTPPTDMILEPEQPAQPDQQPAELAETEDLEQGTENDD